ncbi:MAG TPA: class I SAM-dependent RNA methyltransferase [Gemmatimonadaceae bacterium]|nr:class I SAM-dependent RNA methyltransferase [Gemmatimonadaceae bacterium]
MPTSPSRSAVRRFDLFASTAPGLESIAAGELKALGVKGRQEVGGVAFNGDLDRIYQANLWLRTASRVLVRMARFHASTFYELERRSKKIPWADFLPETGLVGVRVTCRKSRLYHSDAVAERVLGVIAQVAPGVNLQIVASSQEDGGNEEADGHAAGKAVPNGGATDRSQSFIVRIVHDECEISADSSGELLHRRGYRQEVVKAPLRETLAAAMILASGWKRREPLLDPMCGSGTIPIEAALIARGVAPGLQRNFQFMNWPGFEAPLWNDILDQARSVATNVDVDIRGTDRDDGAIHAATRNAERAGVADVVRFSAKALSNSLAELENVPEQAGWILSNPPYGVRVGETAELRNLYARLGTALKSRSGWRLGLLTADLALARQTGIALRSRFSTSNGGIPVSFLVSDKGSKIPTNKLRNAELRRAAAGVRGVEGES